MNDKLISRWDPKGSNLVFIFSTERAGSTMLQMMLAAHPLIHSVPEPSILPPLKYLGFFEKGSREALYEPINQSLAIKEYVDRLPRGTEDYIDACRSYANTLYHRMCEDKPECRYFLDKTPSNVLAWDMIVRLFPNAKYVVLLRHPCAVIDSFANAFYVGDYERMMRENTRIPEFISGVSSFLEEARVAKEVVRYEDLVLNPNEGIKKLTAFLEIDFDPNMVAYGKKAVKEGAMGDPMSAHLKDSPDPTYAEKWVVQYRSRPEKIKCAKSILSKVSDSKLAAYGYPRTRLFTAVENKKAGHPQNHERKFHFYHFKRRIYFALKDFAKCKVIRRMIESVRYYCDLLLRD